ncbi:MAG TPA: metallophosphoesterase, partial [Pirellulales bacterium]|nr:metallophosphoesterase [Pirellulales bacterium]
VPPYRCKQKEVSVPKDKTQRFAVLGDLHYETPQDGDYRAARAQLLTAKPDAVFQLGDQGGYSHCGTWQSFMEGLDFLRGFDLPFATLMGNHDMEGPEYSSDAETVAAWCEAFGTAVPYREIDLGHAVALCLSTTRFRGNRGCCHEVFIDDAQLAWFATALARHRQRPIFVFSHAPVMGSGLRVLQNIHLKCPNAWLNHTDRPERFISLVRSNPQIKLWFSAHNHLGHDYPDSISRVGHCTFVHTGVIGEVSRDGRRHSRLVDHDRRGYVLSTFDHRTGEVVANYRYDYSSGAAEVLSPHTAVNGEVHFAPPAFPADRPWLALGRSVFLIERDMLVEYDAELRSPLGVVAEGVGAAQVRVTGGELQIVGLRGSVRVVRPNAAGRFMQVFEPNPWLEQRLSA